MAPNSIYKIFLTLEIEDPSVLLSDSIHDEIRFGVNRRVQSRNLHICTMQCSTCRTSVEDKLNSHLLSSYPTTDLSAPSVDWRYDISYHIITFKYQLDLEDQNIQMYLLVPPSGDNLDTINR